MIFIIFSFLSTPLKASGETFLGYYPTIDTLYNVDASIWMRSYLLKLKERGVFFLQYSSYLEMGEQRGEVVLDPAFSSYSLVFGLQYTSTFFFSLYLDHYCRHLIDRELEEGKAVFNALNFVFSNIKDISHRFSKDLYFRSDYMFYPQGILVDYLNSKPYYRHRFILEVGKKMNTFSQLSLELEYTLSNDNPREIYYLMAPEICFFKNKGNRTLYAFIKYYLKAKGPLRAPEQLFFFGLGYSFNMPCESM